MDWFMGFIRGSTGMKAMSPLEVSLVLNLKEHVDLVSRGASLASGLQRVAAASSRN